MIRAALVTGGAGFIGSHLVTRLLADGAHVRVLDDLSTGRRTNLAHLAEAERAGRLELLVGSIVDLDACRAAARDVEVVFHQAALPSVPRSVADPIASNEVNVTGTLNVLVAARDAGARRFVMASSSSIYGNTPDLPKHEGMTPSPRSPYALTKLAGEIYARLFHELYGFETVALRYFNVFGERQDPTSAYAAVIPRFTAALLAGEAPEVHGDGLQTRDFTHVDNAVEANLRAATAPAAAAAGGAFNVATGLRVTLLDVLQQLTRLTGASVAPHHVESRVGDVRDSLADLARMRAATGYAPRIGLEEGLARYVAWFREQASSPERAG